MGNQPVNMWRTSDDSKKLGSIQNSSFLGSMVVDQLIAIIRLYEYFYKRKTSWSDHYNTMVEL